MRLELAQEFSQNVNITQMLQCLPIQPQDSLFNRVRGCDQQCPLCRAPCELEEKAHESHRALLHRPKGMMPNDSGSLSCISCFENMAQGNLDKITHEMSVPGRDLHSLYPDWSISPEDPNSQIPTAYWRYVLARFNERFAKEYEKEPAEIPEDWEKITEAEALSSLRKGFLKCLNRLRVVGVQRFLAFAKGPTKVAEKVGPVNFKVTSGDMDTFTDEDLSAAGNSSHETGLKRLESSENQGLNQSDPLDMFIGIELLLRFKPLFLPLYCLIVVVAGVGNSFLLACILSDKKLHNATNFFISNLAAGDLLMCLSCVPLTASYAFDSHGWAFGRPLCHLVPLLQCATVFVSVLSLTAIAVDRYVVVAHPVRRRISVWGCGAVTLGVWLLSLALAAPQSLYTRYLDLRPNGIDLVVCEEFWPHRGNLRLLYSCLTLVASYMIPLLSVSISYCAITVSLKRYSVPGEPSNSQPRWSQRRKKTFTLLVASVLNLLLDLDPDFTIIGKRYINVLQVCCHLVAMSSACYNPFIYASLHSKVRMHLNRYLCPWRNSQRRMVERAMVERPTSRS
ncbi:Prolactin-releasing peptide receptor [Liparis tanakae]|uniref:Prolactin-releasing peptide receptor n=1 Tax=Liparis tanakae TaxID=230148 RepID=A0A4Z2FXS1_9TELE|nr:Prolactin-releasing peptide receptor [Liparis tanakae]